MLLKYIKYFILIVFLIITQKTFVPLISIESISPDLVLLLIIFISVSEGQIAGMVVGFLIGIFLDILSPNFLGLGALTYTITGFVAGHFYDEYKAKIILQSYYFIFIIFFSSFIGNFVYYILFIQGSEMDLLYLLFKYGLGTTAYSVVIGVILVFIFSRRQLTFLKGVLAMIDEFGNKFRVQIFTALLSLILLGFTGRLVE